MERNLWKRIMIGVSVPAMLVLLCIYEYQGGNGMECMFYRYTGLYCPGCGSGRAVNALFHGRFAEAVQYFASDPRDPVSVRTGARILADRVPKDETQTGQYIAENGSYTDSRHCCILDPEECTCVQYFGTVMLR